ncbi:MAG TPA: ABC transporter permease, partial [Candidatus Eisenbacteria bacterium]
RGSFPTLVFLSLLFILVMLGFGLFMSTLAKNQQQAMMGSIFLIMVPMMYLSGLVFPIENMPKPIQLVTWVIPLRYYTNVLRGVFLKGSGMAVLWPEALALAVSGVVVLTLASLRFRKRLD